MCLLNIFKKESGEVDESMFEGFVKPYEFISGILSIEKATWIKSLK
jgi:hypothetical protein